MVYYMVFANFISAEVKLIHEEQGSNETASYDKSELIYQLQLS